MHASPCKNREIRIHFRFFVEDLSPSNWQGKQFGGLYWLLIKLIGFMPEDIHTWNKSWINQNIATGGGSIHGSK